MNPTSTLLYRDQEAAEHAASEYRGIIIDTVTLLERMAQDIDSLKLANVAFALRAQVNDINF